MKLKDTLFFIFTFLRFYSILPEIRDLLGFYCRASIVYNIMLLALKLKEIQLFYLVIKLTKPVAVPKACTR